MPVRLLTPLFLRFGVDAVIAGHDEIWERSEIRGHETLSDGSQVAHTVHFLDVGTADAPGEYLGPLIDTPTLRFLYDSAPYLHDGQAPTLEDLLTAHNPQDQHGTTSHLTSSELADLIAFLLALPYSP